MSSPSPYARNLAVLCAIRACFWMHFFAAVLVPFYTQWGGVSLSQVLVLNAWFMLWNFVLEVPTGSVADSFGRKTSLACGFVLAIAAALIYTSRRGFGNFLVAEIVFAAAYTLHSGADEALAYDSLTASGRERESKRILARMESCKLAGIIVAALTGGWIAQRWGLAAPMRVYLVPGAVGLALTSLLREPPMHAHASSHRSYISIIREGSRYFARHRILVLLTAEMAATNALAWAIIWLFQPLLQRAGLPLAAFGIVQAAGCVGQIALLARVDRLERWLGSKRRLLLVGSAATGLAFIIAGLAASPLLIVAAIVVAFSFGLSRLPIFSSYMNKYVPSAQRATVLSMASMVRTLSIVLINPIIGQLAEWSLSRSMVILGAGLIALPMCSRIEERHLVD